jgi:RNA polymerase sigma factor (TIGR02999 family)
MDGTAEPRDSLLPLLYEELRAVAAGFLRQERRDHTLQPTALVHEAFLRMKGRGPAELEDPARFRAAAAVAMRRILVDHARARRAGKRGGDLRRVSLDEGWGISRGGEVEVLALHEALEELAALDERQARVVELRFFGGLGEQEIAAELGVSLRTVEGDWRMARAWLRGKLDHGA